MLPSKVDLRATTCTPDMVLEQDGAICIATATANAVRSTRRKLGLPDFQVSVRFIFWASRERNLRAAFLACQKAGVVPESVWPWDPVNFMAVPPPDVQALALTHKVVDSSKIVKKVPALKQCLADGFAFAYDGGTHEQLVVGYDDLLGAGNFIIMNSHGNSWGEDGYWYCPYDQFLAQASDCWSVRRIEG